MNKCITRKQGQEGVIKISHFYMSEIVRLCLYTIKTTKDTDLQHLRSQKINKKKEKKCKKRLKKEKDDNTKD
jgi:hypothetical protein